MRIRSIKPEFWRSDDIDALSIPDRLLFIGLWSYVDDSGVGVDKEPAIAADLFAGDLARDAHECSVRVHGGLKHLAAAGLITRYAVNGRRYLHITNWDRHQKINRPSESRYPPPTSEDAELQGALTEGSVRAHADSPLGTGEQGNRGTGEQGSSVGGLVRSAPRRGTRLPDDFTLTDELSDWARRETPGVDPAVETEKFCDYWRAKTGKDATKVDWVATWRNWMRNARDRYGQTAPTVARLPMSDARAKDRIKEIAERGDAGQAAAEAGVAFVWPTPPPENERGGLSRREWTTEYGRTWIKDHWRELLAGMTRRPA